MKETSRLQHLGSPPITPDPILQNGTTTKHVVALYATGFHAIDLVAY